MLKILSLGNGIYTLKHKRRYTAVMSCRGGLWQFLQIKIII